MTQENIARYFDALTQGAQALSHDADLSMIDGLIEVIADINTGDVHHEQGKPTPAVTEQIQNTIAKIDWQNATSTDLRKAVQLAILKVNRDDQTQANHQITPDGIGYLLADLILQTAELKDGDTLLDFAVGTSNLLNTVNGIVEMNDIAVKRIGIDNDDIQLALAAAADELINHDQTTFYQEDVVSLDADIPKAKVVIADLPVGYYPIQPEGAYITQADDGRSFVHQLMIEKSVDFVTDDGWIYLIVPANILSDKDSKKLLQFVTNETRLKAFLQLPNDFFQDQRAAKAILVLRKRDTIGNSEVLMGQYPTLKDIKALQKFLQDIKTWVKLDKEQDRA
ncbi:class I SAM-dependent methyltransferase [Leuconostoc carnosum]|uniref:Type I restriction-modification system methyltransferase subunit() n=2 Tax=Leuconostoc carnosum TaxID=1252 RepID=K0DE38_LEUCJ|nr:class I SAM-dependent methyltransferase [Leuconostoc carnosum]AFT82246.1 type I restriction-modification system methyltransferase subunit() [Leuconostoc carnosum JB16]KAA8327770.1 class I SAM-dependent methyltransferase [Leuconostoc carnosum]QEA33723.1 class I SAM-dependent methyltransferase [Leuconostoc carnosum]